MNKELGCEHRPTASVEFKQYALQKYSTKNRLQEGVSEAMQISSEVRFTVLFLRKGKGAGQGQAAN